MSDSCSFSITPARSAEIAAATGSVAVLPCLLPACCKSGWGAAARAGFAVAVLCSVLSCCLFAVLSCLLLGRGSG